MNKFRTFVAFTWLRLSSKAIRTFRTIVAPRPTSGSGKIVFQSDGVRLRLRRTPTSNLILNGNLIIRSDLGDQGTVVISLGNNSTLCVDGDFVIGSGVQVTVSSNAILKIGGTKHSSGSGITCNTRILVNELISIGEDSIIAWDCFITDSDWHAIEGIDHTKPTFIGAKTWIARGVNVLKGSNIPEGCIVGAGTTITASGKFPSNSLIAGSPAKACKEGVIWCRDFAR